MKSYTLEVTKEELEEISEHNSEFNNYHEDLWHLKGLDNLPSDVNAIHFLYIGPPLAGSQKDHLICGMIHATNMPKIKKVYLTASDSRAGTALQEILRITELEGIINYITPEKN